MTHELFLSTHPQTGKLKILSSSDFRDEGYLVDNCTNEQFLFAGTQKVRVPSATLDAAILGFVAGTCLMGAIMLSIGWGNIFLGMMR